MSYAAIIIYCPLRIAASLTITVKLIICRETPTKTSVWQKSAKKYQFSAAVFCSELFSLPRNGSERFSESLLLFLFHGTEFRVVFSSAEGFGTKFRELLLFFFNGTEFLAGFSSAEGFGREFQEFSVPRNSSVYSIFRGIIFCRKFPTLLCTGVGYIQRDYRSGPC